MRTKILEVRDRATFFPLLCVDMNPDPMEPAHSAQLYLLRRVGYPCDGLPNIAITRADAGGGKCCNDPYHWGDRTFAVAHDHIIKNWERLRDGDVVDVEYILGESQTKKQSERYEVT